MSSTASAALPPLFGLSPQPFVTPSPASTPPKRTQDSDCGSSSGVGMPKAEHSSSEASSLTSERDRISTGIPFVPRWIPTHRNAQSFYTMTTAAAPTTDRLNGPTFAPTNTPSTIPTTANGSTLQNPSPSAPTQILSPLPTSQQTIGALQGNDLFVHVEQGETISLAVGNELQHIPGPATIRMVGHSGLPASALPLHVPRGHNISQIVDEKGILRHLILSPQNAVHIPTNANLAPPRGMRSPASAKSVPSDSSPPKSPPKSPPSEPEILRKRNSEETAENEIDADEKERIVEMLNRIQQPIVARVGVGDADVLWQELDTSEANASGGPFPQIDASEFDYEVLLYEHSPSGRLVTRRSCARSNGVRFARLKPRTEYHVAVRVSLPDRQLFGAQSLTASFRTFAAVPEVPQALRLSGRGTNWASFAWNGNLSPNPSNSFILQLAKGKTDLFETVYEGASEQAKIGRLEPSTHYRARVAAQTDAGRSDFTPPLHVNTTAASTSTNYFHPFPPKLPPPTLVSVSARTAKFSWTPIPDLSSLQLEMSESNRPNFLPVPPESYLPNGLGVNLLGLKSNREYRFRLVGVLISGDILRSDITLIRTHKDRYDNLVFHENRSPPVLQKTSEDENSIELSWRYSSTDNESVSFVLEGAPDASTEWKQCYRGPKTSATIHDPNLSLFRVQIQSGRRSSNNPWSDILHVRRNRQRRAAPSAATPPTPEEPTKSPVKTPQCSAPKISSSSPSSITILWQSTEESLLPDKHSMIFELQRVDKQALIVYSGSECKYQMDNLRPVEHIQLRVRSVVVDNEGIRTEGDWSPIGSTITPSAPTTPPQNIRFREDNGSGILSWEAPAQLNGSDVVEYILSWGHCSMAESSQSLPLQHLANTERTEYSVGDLRPAHIYVFAVAARNEAGRSATSERLEYSSPATVPSAPSQLVVEPKALDSLNASWNSALPNGAIVEEYKLILSSNGSVIRQISLNADILSYTFDDLEAETQYSVEIRAKNAIGWSRGVTTKCSTLELPPNPPVLSLSQSTSNSLKLKWNGGDPLETLYYFLEKESENGKFSLIYDGENHSAKIKSLRESTNYRFRIRSSRIRNTAFAGQWSPVYSFSTTAQPPPSLRVPPIVSEVGVGIFQAEWNPVKAIREADDPIECPIFAYRVQVASKEKGPDGWKVVYNGPATSCTFAIPNPTLITTGRQLRVFVVEQRDGEEILSASSPITVFSTQRTPTDSPRKRGPKSTTSGHSTPSSSTSGRYARSTTQSTARTLPTHKLSLYKRFRRFLGWLKRSLSERDGAFIVLTVFVVVAILIAVLLNNYYDM